MAADTPVMVDDMTFDPSSEKRAPEPCAGRDAEDVERWTWDLGSIGNMGHLDANMVNDAFQARQILPHPAEKTMGQCPQGKAFFKPKH
jgi:hypothetical protein